MSDAPDLCLHCHHRPAEGMGCCLCSYCLGSRQIRLQYGPRGVRRATCQHCKGVSAASTVVRGLCRHCRKDPAIRSQYAIRKKPALPPPERLCRHCERYRVSRPKGLCYRCSHNPDIRNLYPSTSKYYYGEDDFNGPAPLPALATAAPPGSPAKVEELAARLAAKVCLFHPGDAGWDAYGDRYIPVHEEEEDLDDDVA